MTKDIKFDIIKTRVNAQARTLKATWTFETPAKEIKTGVDKLHRPYAVVKNYNYFEREEMNQWLDKCCSERWCSLGDTIWFNRAADQTLFVMKWSS